MSAPVGSGPSCGNEGCEALAPCQSCGAIIDAIYATALAKGMKAIRWKGEDGKELVDEEKGEALWLPEEQVKMFIAAYGVARKKGWEEVGQAHEVALEVQRRAAEEVKKAEEEEAVKSKTKKKPAALSRKRPTPPPEVLESVNGSVEVSEPENE